MVKIKRVFTFVVLITSLLACMDWSPLHYQWWHHGEWPTWAGKDFQQWSQVRATLGKWICPPCLALAEVPMYFAYYQVEAGPEEREALMGHAPTLTEIYWKANTTWYPVSIPMWYLYWLPSTVLWWWLYASDLFSGRLPWPLRGFILAVSRMVRQRAPQK